MSDSWSEETISDYLDDRLSQPERERFELQRRENPGFDEAVEEFLQIRAELKGRARYQLDDRFAGRVVQAIERQAEGATAAVESSLPAADRPAAGKPVTEVTPGPRRDWKPLVTLCGAVAAMLLLGLFLLVPWQQMPDVARQVESGQMESDESAAPASPRAAADGLARQPEDDLDLSDPEQNPLDRDAAGIMSGEIAEPSASASGDEMATGSARGMETVRQRRSGGGTRSIPLLAEGRKGVTAAKEMELAELMEVLEDQPDPEIFDAFGGRTREFRSSPTYEVITIATPRVAETVTAIRAFAPARTRPEPAALSGRSGRPLQLQQNDPVAKLKGQSGEIAETGETAGERMVETRKFLKNEMVLDDSTVVVVEATEGEIRQLIARIDGKRVATEEEQAAGIIRQFESGRAAGVGGGGGFAGDDARNTPNRRKLKSGIGPEPPSSGPGSERPPQEIREQPMQEEAAAGKKADHPLADERGSRKARGLPDPRSETAVTSQDDPQAAGAREDKNSGGQVTRQADRSREDPAAGGDDGQPVPSPAVRRTYLLVIRKPLPDHPVPPASPGEDQPPQDDR